MQKLKKSLENNILKLNFNQSQSFFNIENSSDNKKTSEKYIVKTLTTCFSKHISFFNLLNIFKLKYPLTMNIFKDEESLIEYLNSVEKELRTNDIVLTKINNNILKNNCYSIIKNNKPYSTFFQLKNKTFPLIKILKVLKLHFKKDV
jgi:hypothetical protein